MKISYILTSLALTAGLALTATAKPPKKGKGKRAKGAPPLVKLIFDKDGDGQINDEEKEAIKALAKERKKPTSKKKKERFDTDKDGKLSKEEKKACRKQIMIEAKEIYEAVLNEFDKDGDTKLSDQERAGNDILAWIDKKYPDAILPLGSPKGKKAKQN